MCVCQQRSFLAWFSVCKFLGDFWMMKVKDDLCVCQQRSFLDWFSVACLIQSWVTSSTSSSFIIAKFQLTILLISKKFPQNEINHNFGRYIYLILANITKTLTPILCTLLCVSFRYMYNVLNTTSKHLIYKILAFPPINYKLNELLYGSN